MDALLRRLVAIAQRHRPVLDRLVVDRDAERRADLVLAPVAPADRARLVVLHGEVRAELRVDLLRLLGVPGLAQQGEHRRLHRCEPRVQAQHDTRLTLYLVLVVSVDQEGERRAVGAGCRLDHVGKEALARVLVEVREVLAAVLRVLLQIEVAAVRDALELGPAEGELVLDVGAAARVVRELVRAVLAQPQVLGLDAEAHVPVEALLLPVLVPVRVLAGLDEELHFHLLELARAEEEVARRDLVAERLADLRDAERQLLARGVEHVREVHEHALGGLGTQEHDVRVLLDGPHEGLEHQVELPRLGELAAALAGMAGRQDAAALLGEVVGAEAHLALLAVDERVGEAGDVPRRLPDARVHQDRAVEPHDVAARPDHLTPPRFFDVALELDADRAVVPAAREPAVDLARLEDQAAALREVDDALHAPRLAVVHVRRRLACLGHRCSAPPRCRRAARRPTAAPRRRGGGTRALARAVRASQGARGRAAKERSLSSVRRARRAPRGGRPPRRTARGAGPAPRPSAYARRRSATAAGAGAAGRWSPAGAGAAPRA